MIEHDLTKPDIITSEYITYRGIHRGIAFEVKYFKPREPLNGRFTYYLCLTKRQVKDPELAKLLFIEGVERCYDSVWADLPWHGGITYCDYECRGSIIKAGCDFNHYFDLNRIYTLKGVTQECIETIDAFLSKFHGILDVYTELPIPIQAEQRKESQKGEDD